MAAIRLVSLLLGLLLAGCAGGRTFGPNLGAATRHPGLDCVPFARELTGVRLHGDGADWWAAASGHYARTRQPEVGSILVFQRTARLPHGHLAVVSRLLGPRRIHVIQANWVHDELDLDQLVVDVSAMNDWTAVRVWWPPTSAMGGRVYPTAGFILPPAPRSHESLARWAEPAAERAAGGG